MDKYEYRARTKKMIELLEQRNYRQAMEIADTIQWNRVKNASMLSTVSEIYEYSGNFKKSRDILFVAYDRAPESRKIIYRLGTLALKTGDIHEAMDCYEEFVKIAPNDPNQHILRFKILSAQNSPLEEQIEALEEFKRAEYIEKWAYELAKLYHMAGRTSECIAECDDLILWFSEGKYVYQAMELKQLYKPLTPLQQEKYNRQRQGDKAQEEVKVQMPTKEKEEGAVQAAEVPEEVEIFKEEAQAVAEEETPAEEQTMEMEEEMVRNPGVHRMMPPEEASESEYDEEEILETDGEMKEASEKEVQEVPLAEIQEEMEEKDIKEEPEIQTDSISQTIMGKTIEEAIVNGLAMATKGTKTLNIENELGIDDILGEWESKQEEHQEEEIIQAPLEKEPEEAVLPEMEETEIEEDEEVSDDHAEMKRRGIRDTGVVSTTGFLRSLQGEDLVEDEEFEDEIVYDEEDIADMEDDFFEEEDIPANTKGVRLEELEEKMDDDFEDAFEDEFEDEEEKALSQEEIEIEDEIEERMNRSEGGVSFDTGFVVQGRYDLEAQSEIGLKAGLTKEQKELFSYFVPVRGMSEQIVEVLEKEKACKERYGTSRTGNLLIIGRRGTGKTVLAVDVIKAVQKSRPSQKGKVAIVTADVLNRKKDLNAIISKLNGGALIIERAGKMDKATVTLLNELMEGQTGELYVVLEEQRKPLERLLKEYPEFAAKFTSKLELPVFINDELVTFGQTYAKENGYQLDEMAILALYSRIDIMQRDDHSVTVAEVKEIMDAAIAHSQKGMKGLFKRRSSKGGEDGKKTLLHEQDFKE